MSKDKIEDNISADGFLPFVYSLHINKNMSLGTT